MFLSASTREQGGLLLHSRSPLKECWSWLLVAKHNQARNVDRAAVEGASLQVR